MSKTFQLLKQGEEKIQLSERYKNVTLVLGNTGTGKTTFLQWIAGDNDKLIAKEVSEDTGEYIIEDGNRFGNSTITSKNVFPELVVHTRTDTAYYDCPGFSDSRSTSDDIAKEYFIKKVADHAENVKLIFVVGYPSVRNGVDRQDFMKLIRHATDLVKDINKYQNSIAIMVTKVDNIYIEENKRYILIPDERFIEAIGVFLIEVKLELVEKLRSASISDKEFIFCENAIKFVNTLLMNDGENYTRIGISRRPDESGPLSSDTLLQQRKKHIERIMYENLDFTCIDKGDFSYTISDKSKNDISELVDEINDSVWFNIGNIVENMRMYFRNSVKVMRKKIRSFATSTKNVDADQSESLNFLYSFNVGYNLIEEVKNVTTERLAEKFNNRITALGISGCEEDMLSISNQEKYFSFLQAVSDRVFDTRTWDTLLQPFETYLSDSMQEIQNYINDEAYKINNQINYITSNVAHKIEEHYRGKMRSTEIEKLSAELKKGHGFILKMTQEIESHSSTQELSREISAFKIRSNMYSIFNLRKYLKFLQIMSNKALDKWSSKWIGQFNRTAKYLDESSRWYVFLDNLHKKLSEYNVQKDKNKYNVANIEDWGQEGKLQGISVTRNNFRQFLEKLKPFSVIGHNEIENIEAIDLRVEELRQVLSLTLESRIYPLCQSGKLVIKGDYNKLSDVNVESRKCPQKIIEMEIFALNKIFINQDLNKVGDKLKLVMIAPRWEVIGSKKINLSGSDGQPHELHKANSGTYRGNDGDHGKPGLPGGSAGSFFGIGVEFFNGNMLNIIANGGNGGPGQNGGNGARGKDGDSPSTNPEYYHDKYYCNDACNDRQISGFKCYKYNNYNGYCSEMIGQCFSIKINGKDGIKGGNGGNGGLMGNGGKSGDIRLIMLSDNSEISAFNDEGKPGIAGEGGVGGTGGQQGIQVILTCESGHFLNWWEDWYLSEKYNIHENASSGNKGVKGANGENIQSPDPAADISNKAEIINNYKSYLRENLNVASILFRKNYLNLLNQLDSNSDVKDAYDTLGLFDEFQGSTNQFHLLNKEELVIFYQSLLDRISEYAQNSEINEKSNKNKKSLGYLYTAALSKLYDLKNDSDSTLIIDVGGYLNLVKKNINDLTNLQEKSNKVSEINNYKEAYKTNIDQKIEESNSLIEEQIAPVIEKINTQIEDKIDLLLNETMELQKDAEKNRNALLEKKKELQNTLVWRGLFSVCKMAAQVTKFLGPVGATVGGLIGGVSSMAESLVLGDQSIEQRLSAIPLGTTSTLKEIETQIKANKDEKVASFNKQLEQIKQEMNPHPNLKDMTERVNNIQEEIVKMIDSDVDEIEMADKMKKLDIEFKKELKAKENKLNTQKTNKDQEATKAIKAITRVNQVVQIGALGLEIYSKLKNDQGKIDEMSNAIKQEETNLQMLKQYEDKIYSDIEPTLKNVGKDLKAIRNKLGTKSAVALDVTNWQVQSLLRDMKIQMQELTKGFKVEAGLTRCIVMLEDAMTTLINIYNRIQDYQEQQNLANFIAAVSAPHSADNIQDKLEILIRLNLIVKQYKRAVDALKQWVFPFAGHYLESFILPSHLELNSSNIEDLAFEAVNQIDKIKLKFDKYKTAIQHHDKYIKFAFFDSHHFSTNPFFVWKNEEHKDVISKLLHGKAIVVKADITGSAPDKDAIKFNLIGINFRSANKTIQHELNDKLKGFKVNAIHLGNSYYRYDDKLYVISSESQSIEYSFEKSHTGVPIYRNVVYDKIKDGDLMLSPYAMWKIPLINLTDKIPFNELTMYKDEVDLELVGNGRYVDKGAHIPGLNIDNYYRSDGTIFVIDNDTYGQYQLLDQEIYDNIPHNISNFEGNISLEAWHQSKNEDNATELERLLTLPSGITSTLEEFESQIKGNKDEKGSSFNKQFSLMATSEYPSKMTHVTLSITEHDRFRRSAVIPVTSSASKPTSWLGSVIKFGKELFGKSAALYNKPEEPASDYYNTLHSSSITLVNRLVGEPQPAPTLLEMGDQWIKITDINGLLTFGTLLAGKCTGYRPKVLKALSYDPSLDIKLDIRSQETINAFIDKVQEQAQTCGIEESTSSIFESSKLYTKAIETVRKKLATGQVDGITTSLFEQVVQQNISRIASTSTPAQAAQLLYRVIEDLPNLEQHMLEQDVSLQKECQKEKLANTSSKADNNHLKQAKCCMQSIDQLAATMYTLHMGNTYNIENVFVQNSLQDGN